MKLEDQVCSLELAKRLKELVVKQESLFAWAIWMTGESQLFKLDDIKFLTVSKPTWCAAFTVAELGELILKAGVPLPVWDYVRRAWMWDIPKNDLTTEPVVGYVEKNRHDGTEADARAKMLIYLLENNLIPQSSSI